MKRLALVAFLASVVAVGSADIGSPNVVFDGNAGPYPVRVVARPPNVVPGLADVIVRVGAPDPVHVVLRPVYARVGENGAPQGDEAKPIAGQRNVYTGRLWLMVRGAYSVYVTVSGARGSGTASVPVNSFATGRLGISRGLGALLLLLGAFLLAGLVTIVRAASGESLLPPGQTLDSRKRRRANVTAAVAVPVLGLLVLGGAKWWNSVDAEYQRSMYRPPAVDAVVVNGDSGGAGARPTLELSLHDTASYRALLSAVIPDHGKMMHLFLVKDPDLSSFAHLHPVQNDSLSFSTELPGLPAGHYRVFGDLALENGTTLTVSTAVDVPAVASSLATPRDPDDAWTVTPAVPQLWPGVTVPIENDRLVMVWAGTATPFHAGEVTELRFAVRTRDGAPAKLEPYLGMSAHAVVMHHDGSVFVHLHPMGTVSQAAQQVFAERDRGDTTRDGRLRLDSMTTRMTMPVASEFMLPYEFPKPGRYRIWVQVKADGMPWTATFDADVVK